MTAENMLVGLALAAALSFLAFHIVRGARSAIRETRGTNAAHRLMKKQRKEAGL